MSFDLVLAKRSIESRNLAHDIREWRPAWLVILLADVFAVELCVLLGYLTRLALGPIWPITINAAQFSSIAIGVLALPVALHFMGMYPGYGINPILRLRQRIMASFVLFGLLITWNYLERSDQLSRGILIMSMFYAFIIPFIVEGITRKALMRLKLWGQPTAILGANETAAGIVSLMQRRARPYSGRCVR